MYILSIDQIKQIEEDVYRENLTFSHLHHDLVDHVCCDVEERVKKGIDFNKAYNDVKEEIGIQGLKQIQKDTLFLIDKNYRMMKKSMKTLGSIALALLALAVVFKFQHWPGAGAMMGLGFLITCFMFFPSMLFTMYKEISNKKQAYLYIIAYLGGIFFMLGILFKVQHWPYAHIIFSLGNLLLILGILPILLLVTKNSVKIKPFHSIGIIGIFLLALGFAFKFNHWPGALAIFYLSLIILALVYAPLYYVYEVKNSTKIRIDFIFGIIALIYIILLTTLVNINLSRTPEANIPMQYQGIATNCALMSEQIQEDLSKINNEELKKINDEANSLYFAIENFKLEIVSTLGETDKNSAKDYLNNLNSFDGKHKSATMFLLANNNQRNSKNIYESLNTYKNKLLEFTKSFDLENEFYASKLFFDVKNFETWEEANIGHLPSMYVINNLSICQYQLRTSQMILNKQFKNSLNTNLQNQ